MFENKHGNETAIHVAHDDYVKRDVAEPERNLMRAVLQIAMDDFRKRGESRRDALRYFNSRDDYYLYSFLSVCYHLELCPKTIRRLIGLDEAQNKSKNAGPDEEKIAA